MTTRGSYILTVTIAVWLIFIGHKIAIDGMHIFQATSQEVLRGKVQRIVEQVESRFDFFDDINDIDSFEDFGDFFSMLQEPQTSSKTIFEAKVTRGSRKGELIIAEQSFSPFLYDATKEVSRGDSILLTSSNNSDWFFAGYVRTSRLLGLGFVFVFCLLLFGGKKGFNTIISLSLTCAAIFAVFIPSILSGKNIYLMSVLVCIYTIAMTLLIVIGFNKKSLASVAGCVSGVMIAGIIAIIMDKVLFLTGIVDEHSLSLINLPGNIQVNLRAVIFAGIIIGAMGAIMDVAISISSSLWEIKEKAKDIEFKELFRSGLNIGRDIMGSMANTLILAYIGSSLSVVLLLSIFSGSPLGLFNSEMFAVEILQALAGSLGILFAMPLTALFCSTIYLKDRR